MATICHFQSSFQVIGNGNGPLFATSDPEPLGRVKKKARDRSPGSLAM